MVGVVQKTPCSVEYFRYVIPGSELFEWFTNQSVGDSVAVELPSYASNSKWIGFAVCALFAPQDNPSAVPEDRLLDPDQSSIMCGWNRYGSGLTGIGFRAKQIVSDHLFLVVLPSHIWNPPNHPAGRKTFNEVKFDFKITRAVGNNRSIKVKKCGARALYEHDTEELISKMNQSKSGVSVYETMDCALGKSAYEQGGAIVKAKREATSGSGGSDDEYFSAEE